MTPVPLPAGPKLPAQSADRFKWNTRPLERTGGPRCPVRETSGIAMPPANRALRRAAARRKLQTRRALTGVAALALLGGVLFGALSGGDDAPQPTAATSGAAPDPPVELPRGGRKLLPRYRLVGYYGAPQAEALGALGIGTPAEASAALRSQARAYRGKRPVMPFMELLASIANATPGDDGAYRTRQRTPVIARYLEQARADRELLVLDIQPGRASFDDEVDHLERYLREPDVGIGLDPEWHVGPDEVPGQVIGSVDARDVNRVAARMSAAVKKHDLPQKLLIVHRFTADMIVGEERLRSYPGVALVLNVDGFGDAPNKIAKYEELHAPRGALFSGFKLFYEEDLGLMSPADVLGLDPRPDLIVYE